VTNYLDGVANPFGLAGPPAHFLADLAIFDADLVIFPSSEEAVYRVGRKVTHAGDIWRLVASLTGKTDENGQHYKPRPDSKVMAQHRLVPVTSLVPSPFIQWGPAILQDLAAMDIQRFGGADRFADAIEEREQLAEDHERRTMIDDIDALARDAYSQIAWKTGRRVGLTTAPPQASPPGA
jgi:hypothetical protein